MSQQEKTGKGEVSDLAASDHSGSNDDGDFPTLVMPDTSDVRLQYNADSLVEKWHEQKWEGIELSQEVKRILLQGIGVFILGLGSLHRDSWIQALIDSKILTRKEQIRTLDAMSEGYTRTITVFTNIFNEHGAVFFPEHKDRLKQMVQLIFEIEDRFLGPGKPGKICVKEAVKMALAYPFFQNQPFAEKLASANITKEVTEYAMQVLQFVVIYFCKVAHMHVIYYAVHGKLLSEEIMLTLRYGDGIDPAVLKERGNNCFRREEYKAAIDHYTAALKKDFTNRHLYGNRAQCFINLKQYKEALCDCRRALFVSPNWYKASYRAAEASLRLGDPMDEAKVFIEKSMADLMSMDNPDKDLIMQIKELQKQIDDFEAEKYGTRPHATAFVERAGRSRGASQSGRAASSHHQNQNQQQQQQQQQQATMAPQPKERSEVEKFQVNLREGLEAVQLDNMVRAAGKYEAAIKQWKWEESVKAFMDSDSMVVVRYAFGITAVSQSQIKSMIQEGLQMFQAMRGEKLHLTCPLVLYGLCRAFVAVYKFTEVLEVVEAEGVTEEMKEAMKPLCWPLSKEVISESQLDVFLEEMEKLKALCQHPPEPEALCFKHTEAEEERAIYKDSPTYSGVVSMSCYLRCMFVFHISCWKAYKNHLFGDKMSDKDVIDRACPTPDCGSFISGVCVEKVGKAPISFKSDQKPAPVPRTPAKNRMKPNQRTVAKRQERKELRRQRKLEKLQEAMSSHSQGGVDSHGAEAIEVPEEEQPDEGAATQPSTSTMLVPFKEKEEEEFGYNKFQKPTKPKKRKEKKEKGLKVNVELNFTENPDRERVREQDLAAEEDRATSYGSLRAMTEAAQRRSSLPEQGGREGHLPAPLPKKPVESFSKVVATMPPQAPALTKRDEEIKMSLTVLLRDILQEEGPQRLGTILKREVFQDIIDEASRIIQQFGGLRQYFEKNHDFVVNGDFVGNRKDSEKVKQLADGEQPTSVWSSNSYSSSSKPLNSVHPFLESAPPVEAKSVWDRNMGATSFNPSEYVNDRADSREMTLPTIKQNLNPSAPEFQPLGAKQTKSRVSEIDDFDLDLEGAAAARPYCRDLDKQYATAEDSDTEEAIPAGRNSLVRSSLDVNDIDEIDLEASASGTCPNLEDANRIPSAQSQRSSLSDLSQSGSEFCIGTLYRTASPSSSVSSHKNARDASSPFSTRDTNSPALSYTPRVGDVTRQTGSPVNSNPTVPSSAAGRTNLEKGLGSNFSSNSAPFVPGMAADTAHLTSGSLPPPPKPLKPLAPIGSTSRLFGNASASNKKTEPGAGGIGAWLSASESVEGYSEGDRSAGSPGPVSTAADTADGVPRSSALGLPSSYLTPEAPDFTPASGKGLAFLPSAIKDYTPSYSSLSNMNLASDYTPSSALTVGLATGSLATEGGVTSSPLNSTSTLPLSSALASEFKPSLSAQDYTPSSMSSGGVSSSTLLPHPSVSSGPWNASYPKAGGSSSSWASNSFPSSIRPNEQIVNPALMYCAQPQSSTSAGRLPSSSSSSLPHSNSSWSLADKGNKEEEGDVWGKADAEMQACVETRSTGTCTELTSQEIVTMQSQVDSLNEVHLHKMQLMYQNEHLQKELMKREAEREEAKREAEDLMNKLQNATHQMVAMEGENARIREEQTVRENQLVCQLQSLQQKIHQNSQESASLLQKCALLEDTSKLERSRAIQAEVRVIHEQTENFRLTLTSKIKEVEILRETFPMAVMNWQKSNPGKAVPDQQVQEVMAYLCQAHDIFSRTRDSVLNQLKEQKNQILAGKSLAELDSITNTAPQLPKQPDCLRLSPNGLPVFMPNVPEVRPGVSTRPVLSIPDMALDTSASASSGFPRTVGPPGMVAPTPAPLRPPLSLQRPPGMLSTGAMGMPKFAASNPQLTASTEGAASSRVAPPPLRPIGSLSRGLAVAGAGSVGRAAPPFASAARHDSQQQPEPAARAAAMTAKPSSSYDKLCTCLRKTFPNCDDGVIRQCIKEMRKACNGSLSGMELEHLVQEITRMLIGLGFRPENVSLANSNFTTTTSTNSNGWEVRKTAPPPGISAAWNVEGLEGMGGGVERFMEEEEDPCAICTDELSIGQVLRLECGHRFHDKCIRTWFKQQTTCPKCRSHAPLQEDFPALV